MSGTHGEWKAGTPIIGEIELPSQDLPADMKFFESHGFILDQIYPSDDPRVAVMSGLGLKIKLDKSSNAPASKLNLRTDRYTELNQKSNLTAPNGTVIEYRPLSEEMKIPKTVHKFEIRKLTDSDPWVIGRAGMMYRDLIPDRLGGGIIASHIRIPEAGPVPDMVHYHTVGFQLIYCYKGWVRLVYEDQGPPFKLNAGDCVIQPPEIRHRVLEASEGLEVIEIGVPAEHMTTIDHELELPTSEYNPERDFSGQRFCHHKLKLAQWEDWRILGFEFRETGINEATGGVASVHIARTTKGQTNSEISHDTDILFTFVLEGQMEISVEGEEQETVKTGDAFVVPPHMKYKLGNCSPDLELLEVSLPGSFNTSLH